MINIKKFTTGIIDFTLNRNFGSRYYPKKFRYIIKLCNKNSKYPDFKIKKNFYLDRKFIKLASKKISLDTIKFGYNLNFTDPEDQGYLHRWSWALNLVLEKNNPRNKKFITSVIHNWFYTYQNNQPNINKIEWYPYNISERISNYVILCELNFIKRDKIFIDHLNKQMLYLTKNIELYKNKMSNHALNNARAIFLLSCFTNNKVFTNFSYKLILHLCQKFIDEKGFFKFCSSHYQFIFTRWLLDIYFLGDKYKIKGISKVKKKLNLSIKACNFFLQKKRGLYTFPFFGNISPDFTPNFLISYLSMLSKRLKKISIIPKKENSNHGNKEWLKLFNKDQTIYFRNPLINGFNFNHAHSDFFHFVNYFKGQPFFIDLGRENYLKKNAQSILANSHNSIILNNKGIFDDLVQMSKLQKIGLISDYEKRYQIKRLKKGKIKFRFESKKKYIFERTFELKKKSLIIKNNFNFLDESIKIEMPFFLDNKIKIKKINKCKYLLSSHLSKFYFCIESNAKNLEVKINTSKGSGLKQCSSYGNFYNSKCLNVILKENKNFNTTIKIDF